jgi:hypothetical protein
MVKMTDKEIGAAMSRFCECYAQTDGGEHSFSQWLGVVWTVKNDPNSIYWNTTSQCWDVPDKAAEKIKLLMSPHHHALLKAYEIRNKKDDETVSE